MYAHNLGLYFTKVANIHAHDVALRCENKNYTYAELQNLASQYAQLLVENNCQQGDIIAIGHTKCPQSYALMLAGLMLGIAYVNIDVTSPVPRTLRILETSKPKLIFYDDEADNAIMQNLADLCACPLIALHNLSEICLNEQRLQILDDRMHKIDGASIAYIMFTSGSTGNPKGVAVTHENLIHFIAWGKQCFEIKSQDIFAQISPMYFDNSVFDFYIALFSGASIVPISRSLLTSPLDLVNYIEQMQCTIWFSVPSMLMYLMTMKVLSPERLPNIRSFSFGGEGYPKIELKKLYDTYASRARIVNVYGPTECTCICSAYDLGLADFEDMEGLPTLGQLNQNFDYLILDDEGNQDNIGELCLIGPNVAAGYYNDIERTNASFVTIYSSERFGKRMYKTGDIVREEAGKLYFVGRKDNQIKHMGYRIELEEIEHALIRMDNINQAAVNYERTQALYGRIIAYVASDLALESAHILEQMKILLPSYMLPAKIHVLPSLPKNANGKVDKQALKNIKF